MDHTKGPLPMPKLHSDEVPSRASLTLGGLGT